MLCCVQMIHTQQPNCEQNVTNFWKTHLLCQTAANAWRGVFYWSSSGCEFWIYYREWQVKTAWPRHMHADKLKITFLGETMTWLMCFFLGVPLRTREMFFVVLEIYYCLFAILAAYGLGAATVEQQNGCECACMCVYHWYCWSSSGVWEDNKEKIEDWER